MSTKKNWLAVMVIMFAIVGIISFGSVMRAEGGAPAPLPTPLSDYDDTHQALTSAIQSQKKLRVIVSLNLDVVPEASLTAGQLHDQRDDIAAVQDQVLARLQAGSGLAASGVIVNHRYSSVAGMALTVDKRALATLMQSPEVNHISMDSVSEPLLSKSIPMIGADRSWERGFTGSGWSVAVLDTGIDASHTFLNDKVRSEGCYSTTYDGISTTLCPNGKDEDTAPGAASACPGDEACVHGTHVAGIAAGRGDAFSGVARDADILAMQVFSQFNSTDYCGSSSSCVLSFDSDQLAALERVYQLRDSFQIAAVNISAGRGLFANGVECDRMVPAYTQAVRNLTAAGIAVVASAGNRSATNGISFPACLSQVVSVGSVDSDNDVSSFSNSADILDILAPGSVIVSSTPDNTFSSMQGTSMAAPHVCGAFAVLRSKMPDATLDQLLAALKHTGIAVTDTRNSITRSRIHVDAALNALDHPALTLDVVASSDQAQVGNELTYTARLMNVGLVDAAGVEVRATLPEHTSLVTASNGGYQDGAAVVWNNVAVPREGGVVSRTMQVRVAADASATIPIFQDGMEQKRENWTVAYDENQAPEQWQRITISPHNGTYAWFANNSQWTSDQYLQVAGSLVVPPNAEMRFWHSYDTEANFDGGVIEISTDDGKTWNDLGAHITQHGYNDTVTGLYGNPLGNRLAFTGTSKGYIETRVDLSAYSGMSANIRFRFATDSSTGDTGWWIDDVEIVSLSKMSSTISAMIADTTISTTLETSVISDKPATRSALTLKCSVSTITAKIGQDVTYSCTVNNTGETALRMLLLDGEPLGDLPLESSMILPGTETGGTLKHTVTEADMPGPLVATLTLNAKTPGGELLTQALGLRVEVESGIFLPLISR